MKVAFLAVLTTSLSIVSAISSRAKAKSADPNLDAELNSLRSQLVADSADDAPTAVSDVRTHPPVAGLTNIAAKVVSKATNLAPVDDARTLLQDQLRQSLAKQQHMEEQIHASEASAAWLSDELHNATARVADLTVNLAHEAQHDSDESAKLKSAEDDGKQQQEKILKLQQHEKKLGRMVQKLLKADQDLQTRTNNLQKEASDLQGANKKLLDQNAVMGNKKASVDHQVSDVNKTKEEFEMQLQSTDLAMEKLQKEFTRKAAVMKTLAEKQVQILQKKEDSLDADVKVQAEQLQERSKKVDVLQEKANEAQERENAAENKVAKSDALIKQLQAQKKKLLAEQASLKSRGQKLDSIGATLQKQLNSTMSTASKASSRKEKAEATTCRTVEKELSEVLTRKRRSHKDLDLAVKLARKAQNENAALRKALAQVTEASKELTARDSEASESMQQELHKLQNELQERQTTFTMMKQMRDRESHAAPDQWDDKVEDDVPSSHVDEAEEQEVSQDDEQ
jgi:chromosome segregation ATPase